ncbi:MAG: hypothetical protein AAGF10_07985 [Verrucomicrobiota bacterium]
MRFCEYLVDTGKLSEHPPAVETHVHLKTRSSLKVRKFPPRRLLRALEAADLDSGYGSVARAAKRYRLPVGILYVYRRSPEMQQRLRRDAALSQPGGAQ